LNKIPVASETDAKRPVVYVNFFMPINGFEYDA